MEIIDILLWVMIILIILITIFLCLIYILRKSFRSYPGYLNIILSSVILLDNILRIPSPTEVNSLCYVQAVSLGILDKYMLIIMTINSYLSYIGFVDNKFYNQNLKKLFIFSIIIGFLVSIIFTTIFILQKDIQVHNVCYARGTDLKKTADVTVVVILASVSLFCIVNLLIHISDTIKELPMNRNKNVYVIHYYRIAASLFINMATFLLVELIITGSLFSQYSYTDFLYITDSLIVDLFYSWNKTVTNEIKKISGKNHEEKDMTDDNISDDDNRDSFVEN